MSKANAADIGTALEVQPESPAEKFTYKTLLNKRGELSSFRCAIFIWKILLLWCLVFCILVLMLNICLAIAANFR